jgi:hypothetical protein
LEQAATTKATEKSEEQKDLEALAQSLAAGELSSLRTVASLRGGRRERVFRLAREIDPTFNTAKIDRKIKMEELFTTGIEGRNVASFDTYWQHSGNVLDALDGLYQSGSPAFNMPMNWIRKNAAGDPNLQRFIVAIEPVKKEFESFLLNNRALYVEDRKEAAEFMDRNTGPKQMRAALEQMGKTAQDRFVAKNHQYKRVMEHDLVDPISPEGIASAARLGITAGVPQSSTSVDQPTVSAPPPGARPTAGIRGKATGLTPVTDGNGRPVGKNGKPVYYGKNGEPVFADGTPVPKG